MKLKSQNRPSGMILLEVILATALFAMTALAIVVGLNSCYRSLGKMRLQSQAADLAISKMSEVHIGIVPPEDDGPNEYEEDETLADWEWEIITEEIELDMEVEIEAPKLMQVQVIITYVPTGYEYSMQFMAPEPPEEETEEPPEDIAGGSAP